MKIIIPMAGRGKRLRPLTLTTPKPLIPVAGKPMVLHLVEDIVRLYKGQIEEIAFIIGDFGAEVESQLLEVAEKMGAKGKIYYQTEPLGTAHAIYCAQEAMDGEVVIAFADTLFRADFELDRSKDGVIWVKAVEDPRAFGVVTLDGDGVIKDLVEKPETFVSDLAIIGIYYLKDGPQLRAEIKHLLDNNLTEKGEFQLTNALENMKRKGAKFLPGEVAEWMDCGNKENVLATNARVLEIKSDESPALSAGQLINSVVIQPCFISEGVKIENSVVGPYVSLGKNARVVNSVVRSAVIMEGARLENASVSEALLGSYSVAKRPSEALNLGDYSTL